RSCSRVRRTSRTRRSGCGWPSATAPPTATRSRWRCRSTPAMARRWARCWTCRSRRNCWSAARRRRRRPARWTSIACAPRRSPGRTAACPERRKPSGSGFSRELFAGTGNRCQVTDTRERRGCVGAAEAATARRRPGSRLPPLLPGSRVRRHQPQPFLWRRKQVTRPLRVKFGARTVTPKHPAGLQAVVVRGDQVHGTVADHQRRIAHGAAPAQGRDLLALVHAAVAAVDEGEVPAQAEVFEDAFREIDAL